MSEGYHSVRVLNLPNLIGVIGVTDAQWVVYLVRCADNTLYCGVTNNLSKRLAAHNAGTGAKYTKSRRPVCLEGVSHKMTKPEAFKLEHHVKRLPVNEKLAGLSKVRR